MLFEAIRSGAWAQLSKKAKAVYAVICFHVQESGGFCSFRRLSRDSGVGLGWAGKAVAELAEVGLILRFQGSYAEPNRYALLKPCGTPPVSIGPKVPCFYCGRPSIALDHVIPLTKGGGDEPENLVPACFRCNTLKGAKTAVEFLRITERLMWEEYESERESSTNGSGDAKTG